MSENYAEQVTYYCGKREQCSAFKKSVEAWQNIASDIHEKSFELAQGLINNYKTDSNDDISNKVRSIHEKSANLCNSLNQLKQGLETQISQLNTSISKYQRLAAEEAQRLQAQNSE